MFLISGTLLDSFIFIFSHLYLIVHVAYHIRRGTEEELGETNGQRDRNKET